MLKPSDHHQPSPSDHHQITFSWN